MNTFDTSTIILASLIGVLSIALALIASKSKSRAITEIQVSLEKIKEMNELTVMTAYIKEVVTMKTNESKWFSSAGKIILICPYEIEFRYNLRKARISTAGTTTTVVMPPHHVKAIPGKIQFYDERKAAFLNVISIDFTPEERNQLINDAAAEAIRQAGVLQGDLEDKVQASAKNTLKALAHAFGNDDLVFVFESSDSVVHQINETRDRNSA